ncbi:hypothetical protein Hanom_Chr14g01286581 [Helianthus anomalus]
MNRSFFWNLYWRSSKQTSCDKRQGREIEFEELKTEKNLKFLLQKVLKQIAK